jgi:nitrite reductase/ring-hydroxylating ferredoxin subunit
MSRYIVGTVAEVPPGERKIVEVEGRSIGVFNVHGTFYALRNTCPHQGGPLCRGSIKGMTMPSAPGEYVWAREGEILRCPWHGWEFDLTTGRAICEPHRTRVRTYEVTVEAGNGVRTSVLGARGECLKPEPPAAEIYPVTVEAECIVLHL